MSFQNIKGHDSIVAFFREALRLNRVGSSYLFFGPDGVGKNLVAGALIKALNCLKEGGDSCDECPSCAGIENKTHPDAMRVRVLENKKAVAIEQIRELQRRINLRPYEGRVKSFIIEDANLMTPEAANCLLKTLEEPPPASVIILITSRPEEILATIKSRCRQIRFRPLALDIRIGLAMRQGFSREEAVFLARMANSGSTLRPARGEERFFDQKNRALDELTSTEPLLAEGSFIFDASRDGMKFMISILESWFRDILVLKLAGEASLVINSDRLAEARSLCGRFSAKRLEAILGDIENARFLIDRNVGPKIALNSLKIKMAERMHD